MYTLIDAMRELVIANRILANEGVVDAFGHVSIRHPDDPDRFIMSCSRSPGIVTLDDLLDYTLDSEPVEATDIPLHAERYIHGAILERRPDLNAVVHNHSHAVIPFGLTGVPLRPVVHVGSTMGGEVPIWDIRDSFGDTSLLVLNQEQGRDLAKSMGDGLVALMRGHGCAVGGRTVKEAVMLAIYLEVNAKLQMQAMQMGEPIYLTPGEIELGMGRFFIPLAIDRSWEYWKVRAGCAGM